MILITFAAAGLAPGEFPLRMNEYLACLQAGTPSDLASRDYETRVRVYRSAAAQCSSQRAAAIDAAVRDRPAGTSEDDARRLAIDIIETLDPSSSHSTGTRR
jgi:hypothetical protein